MRIEIVHKWEHLPHSVGVWYRRQVNFGMFVHLIRMVGLRDRGVILVQASGCPTSSSEECSICPRGLVVGGTSFGRERECVPGLSVR
jgi:hypothetical protein